MDIEAIVIGVWLVICSVMGIYGLRVLGDVL
jgi:hypothetical protein